jgi:hypothetical protein
MPESYILFLDKTDYYKKYKKKYAQGRVAFGELMETFTSSLEFMSKIDYLNQWMWSLSMALSGSPSSLITDWCPRCDRGSFGMMYSLYPGNGDEIKIRQNMIIPDIYFSDLVGITLIKPEIRQSKNNDGELISEWTIERSDLLSAMNNIYRSKYGGFSCRER